MKSLLSDLEFNTVTTDKLTDDQKALIRDLFAQSYRQANQNYLFRSLKVLRKIAMALDAGRLVGFSLADSASLAIPRMEGKQLVMMGGIGCIDPQYRRLGLFSHLANLAGGGTEAVFDRADRVLACSRIAHPASFRTLRRLPGFMPNEALPLSDWHLEVGAVLAELYNVELKPGTLIVKGDGNPIGYPNIEVDVSENEWQVFSEVDRDQGDSVLGMAWAPTPPAGW